MTVGLIPTKYQSQTYFNYPNLNAIGLAPTTSDTTTAYLDRQFLYSFSQQYSLPESYAFLLAEGANLMYLGLDESYQIPGCEWMTETQPVDLSEYAPNLAYNQSTLYNTDQLDIRVGNFYPPIAYQKSYQRTYIDTFYRAMHVPSLYYDWFVDNLFIQYLTCGPFESDSFEDPEMDKQYTCVCNAL